MKRLLVLGLAFLSTALAVNEDPRNLAGQTICFNKSSVQINSAVAQLYPTLTDTLYDVALIKLKAYRIPLAEDCVRELRLQVDGLLNGTAALQYVIELEVFQTGLLPGVVQIWSTGSYGNLLQSESGVSTTLRQSVSNALDKFAADYATGNP